MKITFLSPAVLILSLVATLSAQEVNSPKAYRATTKSSFQASKTGRNPFWPIGFVPKVKTSAVEEDLLRIPVENFKLTAVVLGNPSIAVINGKDYTRGQVLVLPTATGTIKILVTNIEDGVVTVQYKDKIGKILITRK